CGGDEFGSGHGGVTPAQFDLTRQPADPRAQNAVGEWGGEPQRGARSLRTPRSPVVRGRRHETAGAFLRVRGQGRRSFTRRCGRGVGRRGAGALRDVVQVRHESRIGGHGDRRPMPHGAVPVSDDRKSTRLNSSHVKISYAVFCLKKKKKKSTRTEGHHSLATNDRTNHAHGAAGADETTASAHPLRISSCVSLS